MENYIKKIKAVTENLSELKDQDVMRWLVNYKRVAANFGLPKEPDATFGFAISNMIVEKKVSGGPALSIVKAKSARDDKSESILGAIETAFNSAAIRQSMYEIYDSLTQESSGLQCISEYSSRSIELAKQLGLTDEVLMIIRIRKTAYPEWLEKFDLAMLQIGKLAEWLEKCTVLSALHLESVKHLRGIATAKKEEESVNAAQRYRNNYNNNRNNNNNNRRGKKCFNCQGFGHFAKDCPSPKSSNVQQQSSNKPNSRYNSSENNVVENELVNSISQMDAKKLTMDAKIVVI
jgi:hypothetical protein